ncbi:hypothetical protein B0T16DRAFT_451193 [Cercophora newfieldiana]|uniref:Uncharacterized protein n=1 Tax=Cercophora newfieldiana TaxID=92897 RepID=A0AA39YMZ5_9PEZI|nr:hypothetical protein B0T16DRAFT_451193 [Cercophora newfieldiana]
MDEPHTHAEEKQAPQSTQTRKRQNDSDIDDAEPQAKRARTTLPTSEPAPLTRKNLALFNKMGKEKSSDPSNDSGTTGTTKTISTTSPGFADKARENGIFHSLVSRAPLDLEEIHRQLPKRRMTASPPKSVYEDYAHAVKTAPNEGYKKAYNQAFTRYPKDVGFNNGLSAPQPDFVEGVEEEEYHPFPIGTHVPSTVLYKDKDFSVTLPHIAGEWKRPGGDMGQAELQSRYDGAALVYARNQALSYMGKSDPFSIITFTTDGTTLKLFAHHATLSKKGTLEYHQYPIKKIDLVQSYEGYKEGRRLLRNAQDRAREQSHALKDQLKEYYEQQEEVPPLLVPGIEPLDDCEDEGDHGNEGDYEDEVVEHQPEPVHEPVNEPVHEPVNEPVHEPVNEPVNEPVHEPVNEPVNDQPTPPTSSKYKSSSGKQKASTSQSSHNFSRHVSKRRRRSYWKQDRKTGRYYRVHSNGTVIWFKGDEHAYKASQCERPPRNAGSPGIPRLDEFDEQTLLRDVSADPTRREDSSNPGPPEWTSDRGPEQVCNHLSHPPAPGAFLPLEDDHVCDRPPQRMPLGLRA